MNEKSVLEMRDIHKSFPGVKALQAVDFTLRKGEIHALMGENGAGKSTLIKVLTGVYEKDKGEIYLKGYDKAVAIRSPQDAQNAGISTVYQEITLCPNLSVAENMYIGRTKGAGMNWKKMNRQADEICSPWIYRQRPISSFRPVRSRSSRWLQSPERWIWTARC